MIAAPVLGEVRAAFTVGPYGSAIFVLWDSITPDSKYQNGCTLTPGPRPRAWDLATVVSAVASTRVCDKEKPWCHSFCHLSFLWHRRVDVHICQSAPSL